ncbi:putative RDD family membrane protein YckC [Agromyces terreus]|uniref:RDD family membrane protein YckC n=1 Tax=Agromyces terreus TaxID=424795 RepID=A0A9X2KD36_9MICO|nr:RDD family protein [Agromyces terreus]MCP2371890.1 putative RDD family membrane protein YckC [Agromyces terreus]
MPDSTPTTFGRLEPSRWPGQRLGLPDEGRGSVGRVGRRFLAIAVDWAAAILIALAFAPYSSTLHSWLTLGIFVLMQIVFIPTIGGSVGHRVAGLRIVPISGGWVGLWRPIVRTVLLAIVVPVLVWDSDQRGFHDKIAGTVLIRA